jgi:hypothetical protein
MFEAEVFATNEMNILCFTGVDFMNVRGQFEKFVDGRQYAAVTQRGLVTYAKLYFGGNVVMV